MPTIATTQRPPTTSGSTASPSSGGGGHAEYRTLGPADVPGAATVFDVRRCTLSEGWGDVPRLVLGAPPPG